MKNFFLQKILLKIEMRNTAIANEQAWQQHELQFRLRLEKNRVS